MILTTNIVMTAKDKPRLEMNNASEGKAAINFSSTKAKDGVSRNLFYCFQQATNADQISDFNKCYNYEVLNTEEKISISQNATPKGHNQGDYK